MALNNYITDPATSNAAAVVAPSLNEKRPPNGLVVYSEPRRTFDSLIRSFMNTTLGNNMAVNGSSGDNGTEYVYNENHGANPPTNGTAEWDATNLVQNNFIFNNTTHAHSGYATIADYTLIDSGETVTINGTNITNTTLTAGVDWTAAVSNAATATSLASAINGVDGVSALATGAVVLVIVDIGSDITSFTTSGDYNELSSSAQSIDATATTNNNSLLFDNAAGTITVDDYISISGWIYITGWPVTGYKDIELRVRNGGTNQGNLVVLSDYINTTVFNAWQNFVIPIEDLAISGLLSDQIVLITRSTGPGVPPDYFIDYVSWNTTSGVALGSTSFVLNAEEGTISFVSTINIMLVDEIDSTLANGTMPSLSYDAFLGVSSLVAGITITARRRGKTSFSTSVKQLSDLLSMPGVTLTGSGHDGTNTWIVLEWNLEPYPFPLDYALDDNVTVTINDDMTNLLLFTATARILVHGELGNGF